MASFAYNKYKSALANADIDWDTDTIKVALVMTNTTADTEDDTEFLADFTLLDEYDGANYARKTLANASIIEDFTNDQVKLDADDPVWSGLNTGTRQCVGAVIFKDTGADATSRVIFYQDGWTAFDGNDVNTTLSFHADGAGKIS